MSENIEQSFSEYRTNKLYDASNDSVDLINEYCSGDMSDWPELDQEQVLNAIRSNKEHLEYVLTLDLWADKDVTSWSLAVEKANAYLA